MSFFVRACIVSGLISSGLSQLEARPDLVCKVVISTSYGIGTWLPDPSFASSEAAWSQWSQSTSSSNAIDSLTPTLSQVDPTSDLWTSSSSKFSPTKKPSVDGIWPEWYTSASRLSSTTSVNNWSAWESNSAVASDSASPTWAQWKGSAFESHTLRSTHSTSPTFTQHYTNTSTSGTASFSLTTKTSSRIWSSTISTLTASSSTTSSSATSPSTTSSSTTSSSTTSSSTTSSSTTSSSTTSSSTTSSSTTSSSSSSSTTTTSSSTTSSSTTTSSTTTTSSAGPTSTLVPGGGSCGCQYRVEESTQLTASSGTDVTTQDSFADCLQLCDNRISCAAATFQTSTGECTTFAATYTTNSGAAYSDYTSGILAGSCSGSCTS